MAGVFNRKAALAGFRSLIATGDFVAVYRSPYLAALVRDCRESYNMTVGFEVTIAITYLNEGFPRLSLPQPFGKNGALRVFDLLDSYHNVLCTEDDVVVDESVEEDGCSIIGCEDVIADMVVCSASTDHLGDMCCCNGCSDADVSVMPDFSTVVADGCDRGPVCDIVVDMESGSYCERIDDSPNCSIADNCDKFCDDFSVARHGREFTGIDGFSSDRPGSDYSFVVDDLTVHGGILCDRNVPVYYLNHLRGVVGRGDSIVVLDDCDREFLSHWGFSDILSVEQCCTTVDTSSVVHVYRVSPSTGFVYGLFSGLVRLLRRGFVIRYHTALSYHEDCIWRVLYGGVSMFDVSLYEPSITDFRTRLFRSIVRFDYPDIAVGRLVITSFDIDPVVASRLRGFYRKAAVLLYGRSFSLGTCDTFFLHIDRMLGKYLDIFSGCDSIEYVKFLYHRQKFVEWNIEFLKMVESAVAERRISVYREICHHPYLFRARGGFMSKHGLFNRSSGRRAIRFKR